MVLESATPVPSEPARLYVQCIWPGPTMVGGRHVQPVPVTLVTVIPAGTTSLTVMPPAGKVIGGPTLVTHTLNQWPPPPPGVSSLSTFKSMGVVGKHCPSLFTTDPGGHPHTQSGPQTASSSPIRVKPVGPPGGWFVTVTVSVLSPGTKNAGPV